MWLFFLISHPFFQRNWHHLFPNSRMTPRLCKSLASRRCMSPYYKAAGRRGANFLSKRISGSFGRFLFFFGGEGGKKNTPFLGKNEDLTPWKLKILETKLVDFCLGGGRRRTHHCWEESDSLTPSFDWLVLDLFHTAVEREKERDLFFWVSFFLRENNQGKVFLLNNFLERLWRTYISHFKMCGSGETVSFLRPVGIPPL